jgi:tetratricopeptide (TPR) repeat protein
VGNQRSNDLRATGLIGVALVFIALAMSASALAERAQTSGVPDCDISAMNPGGGRVYLLHRCIADRDLALLARSAVNGVKTGLAEGGAKHFSTIRAILDLPQDVLEQVLRVAGQQDVPQEDIAEQLVDKALAHHALTKERLGVLNATEPTLNALADSAREAALAGRYEEAADLLTKAGIAAENLAQSDPATAPQSLAYAAAARAALGQIALIKSDYKDAASYLEAALRLVSNTDAGRRAAYLEALANAYYLQGRDKGDTAALADAVDVYRTLLNETSSSGDPVERALIEHKQGNALLRLGARTGELESLREAVTAFRDAFGKLPPAERWRERAAVQHDTGTALLRLGLAENSKERLEETITAFRESLKEAPRERTPHEWSNTQSSLGTALWSLGSRENSAARYDEAATAFRQSLKETNRDHTPLSWAARQNNLGATLMALGESKNTTSELREAIAAFKLALETYSDESATYYIGGVKDNLAKAEQMLKAQVMGTGQRRRD